MWLFWIVVAIAIIVGAVSPSTATCRALVSSEKYADASRCFYHAANGYLNEVYEKVSTSFNFESPVSVEKGTRTLEGVALRYLKVTSKDEDLSVNSLLVNRGSCSDSKSGTNLGAAVGAFAGAVLFPPPRFPVKVDYGNSITISVDCDPIEVTVVTNKGSYTSTWNR